MHNGVLQDIKNFVKHSCGRNLIGAATSEAHLATVSQPTKGSNTAFLTVCVHVNSVQSRGRKKHIKMGRFFNKMDLYENYLCATN